MDINYSKVRRIVGRFRTLDAYQAYYVKDEVRMERVGPVAPETDDVLRRAFAWSQRVLDVGCGDGRTLLRNAGLFGHGTGIDESEECMIAAAVRARDAKGVRNVDFRAAKAVDLPFADDAFDMVFSERGPLGHCDETLTEALRVLQPGGLLFVETLGDFQTLGIERDRFVEHGVRIQTLVASRHALVFEDFYELLKYACSVLVYCGDALPSPDDSNRLEGILSRATDESGRLCIQQDTIWIAGSKAT